MSANLWGYYRVRRTDGFIMIRCPKCGERCYYDPDRMILNAGRYTDKNGDIWVKPFLFFVTCMKCDPPRTIQEYLSRAEQMPETECKKYDALENKLLHEYQNSGKANPKAIEIYLERKASRREGKRIDKRRKAADKADQPET